MTHTLYIVDVFSLMFQVFHGIPAMNGPKGQPANAIFGFTRDLKALLENDETTHLICALDSPGKGKRNEIYADYKANRSETPEDLLAQIPAIKEVIQAFRCPAIEFPGWEADDVIATLSRQSAERGMQVRIVTNDKDARQLISPAVQLFNIRKQTFLDEKALMDDWGIRPDQVVDFQSLVGDSTDNVPGVPLVGPKKAQALLEQFGTLDDVLEHADEAKGAKLRENLKTFADQARISRELVRLNQHLPLEMEWDYAEITRPDYTRLLEIATEFGFRRFQDEFQQKVGGESPEQRPEATAQVIRSSEGLERLIADLRREKTAVMKLETTSADPMQAEILCWSFGFDGENVSIIPARSDDFQPLFADSLSCEEIQSALRPVLQEKDIAIHCANMKPTLRVLEQAGISLASPGIDPIVGDYLLDSGARSHNLPRLIQQYLHETLPDLFRLASTSEGEVASLNEERLFAHIADELSIHFRLCETIQTRLRQDELWELYWDLERPLIAVLAKMEQTGIRVDVEELRHQSEALKQRLEELESEIHTIAGREFNIASPLQLRQVLFDELNLPVIRKTKTGPSTAQDVLENLAKSHELPAKIIEHRHLAKLKGTYLDALPKLVNCETGQIHAKFHQVVASTGRLSSSDPNLQNIPIRTEEGRIIRRAFVPSQPDWRLVCADYSQIELRMLAHFCQDRALLEAFQRGDDIHTAVAAEVFDVVLDDVDKDQRRIAKAVNFGIIYGQSPFGLAAALNIDQQDAARFIDGYFEKYAGVSAFLNQVLNDCAKNGFTETILNRRRKIAGVRSRSDRAMKEHTQLNQAERFAVNSVIQGSAADLIKVAMVNIDTRMQRERTTARMLLQIHDELVFESPASATDSVIELVRQEMEQAMSLDVPLKVDISTGSNWLDAK